MLSHLLYVSVRNTNCTDEEIQKILASCRKNNASVDITGVLLYSNTNFVQYLEGEYKQIISLYDKIKADNRHKNAVLVSSAPIKEKIFPSWQMGTKQFDQDNIEFQTAIDASEMQRFNDMLRGQKQSGVSVLALLKKFFK